AKQREVQLAFRGAAERDNPGGVEFAAGGRFGGPRRSALPCRRLFDTPALTCASPEYVARHGRPGHPNELASGQHECVQYLDPATGRPFPWEFRRGEEVVPVDPQGRLVVNDVQALLAACLAGHGICQTLELYARPL